MLTDAEVRGFEIILPLAISASEHRERGNGASATIMEAIPLLLADRRAMAERIAGMERVVEAARNMIEDAKNNVHRMTPLGPLIQALSALKTGGPDE